MTMNEYPDDDHYIPNPHNAHLDMQDFETKLRAIAEKSRQKGQGEKEIIELFYLAAQGRLTKLPTEPADDELICRFLTPKKLLWFVSSKNIRFCSALEFDDPKECSLPEDYENSVARVLIDLDLSPREWENQKWQKGQDWLMSCWTALRSHHDDSLIWHKYAEGPEGIGITIRYGELKDFLKTGIDKLDADGQMRLGCVSYDFPLRTLPFNKRRMYRSENEVRFSLRHFQQARDAFIDVGEIFSKFGLRFSPDAPDHHRRAVKHLWQSCGGAERFQEPDGG